MPAAVAVAIECLVTAVASTSSIPIRSTAKRVSEAGNSENQTGTM